MHPDYARASYALQQQPTRADLRREEHAAAVHRRRLDRPHRSRRWTLNWTMLSPRDVGDVTRQGRSTWAIIISASRPH
ncbi:MAG TPA: hypothetical protein VGI00_08690 [Streptosporangiaceae bacterium]|jgi:hypothetical protein